MNIAIGTKKRENIVSSLLSDEGVKRIAGFASSEGRLSYCQNILSPLIGRLHGILCPQVILLHV